MKGTVWLFLEQYDYNKVCNEEDSRLLGCDAMKRSLCFRGFECTVSFETPGCTNPARQRHIAEDMNPKQTAVITLSKRILRSSST